MTNEQRLTAENIRLRVQIHNRQAADELTNIRLRAEQLDREKLSFEESVNSDEAKFDWDSLTLVDIPKVVKESELVES